MGFSEIVSLGFYAIPIIINFTFFYFISRNERLTRRMGDNMDCSMFFSCIPVANICVSIPLIFNYLNYRLSR
jgi:hypothetical protein